MSRFELTKLKCNTVCFGVFWEGWWWSVVVVHVSEQENTRRVVNNRFNECVKAGGSVRACRVKQTL